MFNLNENNRIVMSWHPADMRMGVNCLSGQVRQMGLDPTNGDVYIFVGRSRKVMKILHWEHGGYVMYYKRLEQWRFHPRIFLRRGIGFRSMQWSELVLLIEGISAGWRAGTVTSCPPILWGKVKKTRKIVAVKFCYHANTL